MTERKKEYIRVLAPCGILGYGFPTESFNAGIAMKPDAIVVDAGSTDAGPHKLGANVAIVSRMACRKDLERIILAGNKLDIPVIIGSAGGSGGRKHVEWTLSIVNEILERNGLTGIKKAIIWADIPKEAVLKAMKEGRVSPLGSNVPELTEKAVAETTGIVAQMGCEPIEKALRQGYKLIIAGRAYDPAPFAAVGVVNGFDKALSYHMGKILECGALCCEPGTTKDCIMAELHDDYFDVFPTSDERKCNTTSVAAHTFYEKEHPYELHGPGIVQNLKGCTFEQIAENKVRVRGSRIMATPVYQIKMEGARLRAYRTFVIAGIRDPLLINQLESVEELVKESIKRQYSEIDQSLYAINFMNYGINGVMGDLEPTPVPGHEVCVLFEVLAKEQEIANTICASLRSTFLHYGYKGRKSTAGNLAFPFAPSDVQFGPVYEFSVYHLMDVDDACSFFPVEEF